MFDDAIIWFRYIRKNDIPVVGGKGANLGEMTNHNLPVPGGFVVSAKAYFEFINSTGIYKQIIKLTKGLDVDNTAMLEDATAQIRTLIIKTKMSEELSAEIQKNYMKLGEEKLGIGKMSSMIEAYVAVRSSATAEDLPEASFAGQQETYLNVKGRQEVVEAVRRCWASLFTPRATFYRAKQGFDHKKVGIAVVVQKMINSESAGVMFTADPTGDTSKIIIEAAVGLGEAVVSGAVTPDNYVLDKKTYQIITKKIGNQKFKIVRSARENKKVPLPEKEALKQKIHNDVIVELARLGKKIETIYGAPQDIEWAYENYKVYVVQTRAITTLKSGEKPAERVKTEEEPILQGLPGSPGIVIGKVLIAEKVEDAKNLNPGDILVTKMTDPDWVVYMRKAGAIVTDEGGRTAHAAIVSRELGIPCVVGTSEATQQLSNGQLVTVDGYTGAVYDGKVEVHKPKEITEQPVELVEPEEAAELKKEVERIVGKEQVEKIVTQSATKMDEKEIIRLFLERIACRVKVNVALPEAAEKAAQAGAEGVGLLRAEHMIAESGIHPAEFIRRGDFKGLVKTVKGGVKAVASHFKGKPVWYRTFDARTDEFRKLAGGEREPTERNPMIGWHGIRRDLDQPEIFKAQLQAVKELVDEGFDNLGVMLPFVQSVEELRQAKKLMDEVGLNYKKKKVEIGVMVETPAAVWIIDELIQDGIDFVSFGTNDLTQLTLGIDRGNEHIQKWFNELHPAILRQMEYVIKKCKSAGVKTSICGQAGSNPEMVKRLVKMGIDSVSANIDAVKQIKNVVIQEEKARLLKKAVRREREDDLFFENGESAR